MDFDQLYHAHADTVYRVCMMYLKNVHDAEDAMQETFLKLWHKMPPFSGMEHQKAWLIVTAGNVCKNKLRSQKIRNLFLQKAIKEETYENSPLQDETLQLILDLPPNIKMSLYLYYYEGYTSGQIADLMGKSDAAVRKYLQQGRQALKETLKEEMQ